jgi:hypothetical protein
MLLQAIVLAASTINLAFGMQETGGIHSHVSNTSTRYLPGCKVSRTLKVGTTSQAPQHTSKDKGMTQSLATKFCRTSHV